MSQEKAIKVLIVDDMEASCQLLKGILQDHYLIGVVGIAHSAAEARSKIKSLNPDVITLDIEMPEMNGIVFLGNLMRLHPLPTIVISGKRQQKPSVAIEALDAGAIDFMDKPKGKEELALFSEELIKNIIMAVQLNVGNFYSTVIADSSVEKGDVDFCLIPQDQRGDCVCAIGGSTGSVSCVREILQQLPQHWIPVVIVVHMRKGFTASFAKRLNKTCPMNVREVVHGDVLQYGTAYIAPAGQQLRLKRRGEEVRCNLSGSQGESPHSPSVDVLFESVLQAYGKNSVNVLLTGMGEDGAHSLLKLKKSGAETVVQDKESSVVWGMPGKAVQLGAASKVLPLSRIQLYIKAWVKRHLGIAIGTL